MNMCGCPDTYPWQNSAVASSASNPAVMISRLRLTAILLRLSSAHLITKIPTTRKMPPIKSSLRKAVANGGQKK